MQMDNKENKRTSRESDSRKANMQKTSWAPPSSLDAPPAPQGFSHRWIRISVAGFDDTANVKKQLREGWEFVRSEEMTNSTDKKKYPVVKQGQ